MTHTEVMDLLPVHYQDIVENLYDGLYVVDTDRKILLWNKAAEEMSGYPAFEVVGRTCADNILTHVDSHGCNLCEGLCPLAASMKEVARKEAEVWMHHKNGHRVPVRVRTSPIKDSTGNVVGGVEVFTVITESKLTLSRIQELEKMALLDNLTQIANRSYLQRELHMLLEERKRFNAQFGILLADVDFFKQFNDNWGHDVGDKVLQFVARNLTASVRPFDMFGRWGGEEFLGIIRYSSHEILNIVAERVRFLVQSSYLEMNGHELRVTVSLGGTQVQDGDTIETMLKRADQLLYQSKKAGRNRATLG